MAFVCGRALAQSGHNLQSTRFMVVGYTRNHINLLAEVKKFQLEKLTHLNIAFLNPDSAGKFSTPTDLKKVCRYAHKKHVQVLLSIAGGAPPKYLSGMLAGDKQEVLISSLLKMVVDNKVDGIDVDLEGRMIDSNYESFVIHLGVALKAKQKLMTAAIATYYAKRYTDRALAQFDFVNEMSYDKTGPWDMDKPGQHAPYDMAVQDLDYWTIERGIPKAKLNLGLPFYGYGFGKDAPTDMAYKNIVNKYPDAADTDQVSVSSGGTIYYNGALTIKKKTKLAISKAGGVMMWQLLQDAEGDLSLLKVVSDEIELMSQQ
ncbi:hypothetical protein A0256_24340 [Mucilaginibacter sp. PAMC 26640]|nr:hypothetical protein A0256_24340 [Mucilaginibacter sp. PAMC 26640]